MSALGTSSSYLPSRPDSFLSQSQPRIASQSVVSPPYTKQQHSNRSFVSMGSVDLRNQPNSNVSLESTPGSTFGETLKTWGDPHIARWLAEMKCGMHAATFRANDIRGDLLLELDQSTLKEMSITSIGDRIRILNGVKLLRQRAADKTPSPVRTTARPTETHTRSNSETLRSEQANGSGRGHPRKESQRPPPLVLQSNASKGDNLPVLVGDGPDSARTVPQAQPVRPLPVPNRSTPNATQLSTPGGHRGHLPPPPPPPSSQIPPPPPGANRTPGYTPALPSQLLQTPTNGASWDPSRSKVPTRSTSPLQLTRVRGPVAKAISPNSGRGTRIPNHPYSGIQSTLHPPANSQPHNLSPIEEAFANTHISTASSTTPPTQSQYSNSSRPTYNSTPPSLDDIRKKIVKFVIPSEGTSYKIDVTDCSSGHEVIEKVLKKIGKGSFRSLDSDGYGERSEDGYLSVDGWAVYTDFSDDLASEPLSGAQLLSICNAPDHPARERGLTVRRPRRFEDRSASPLSRNLNPPTQTPKSTKRASSISILSSLGVRNPEVALSDPPSPTAEAAPSSSASPVWQGTGKRPSKLRNFFGQRPPSELITSHLGEFFPSAEPNVLRTARHSMALARQSTVISKRRQSTASNVGGGLASRFSVSTQGSNHRSISPPPPPLPTKPSDGEPIPRMSLSTEDGRSVDLHSEDEDGGASGSDKPQLLPPIPLEDSSFSESMEEITANRPISRAKSTKRLSFMSELRSQRDVSDTASLMTVDEVTAEIENRRASKMRDPDLEEWTKVDTEPAVPADEGEDEGTLATEDDLEDDLDDDDLSDDEFDLEIPTRSGANKWIKGRLIGAGSFGQVYLGMDASSGLLMAVKQVELPKGNGPNHERKKSMLSALEREIELLKVLQHENIVQYLYSSLDDEFLNIFLEYVPGGSVATLLQNYGAFEETLVRNFVRQILRGLNYLHERDIIHRDIKGANILVDNKGGVKISDFGISKKADGNIMVGGNKMNRPSLQGSVFWMAPEVVKQTGHTKKADIWSVGCLVVEMLTGEHPWAQLTQMQAIFKIGSSARPTIPTDISPEAQDFLQKTFEINHESRPPAADLLQHPWLSRRAKKAANAAAAAAAAAANEAAS